MRETLRHALARLSGKLPVPPELTGLSCALLHVSDTPSTFYPDLARLVAALRPRFIIHTGDLADEVKLRSGFSDRPLYAARVEALLAILESSAAERVFLVMGNHDDPGLVRGLASGREPLGRFVVAEGCLCLDLEGVGIAASHRPEDLWERAAEFNLYGHDTSVLPPDVDGRLYLNGNVQIRVLDLATRTVHSLDYPRSVHDVRQKKRKIGL
jgi:3',5'-cyclic AMP phosphodiesterase CpdA